MCRKFIHCLDNIRRPTPKRFYFFAELILSLINGRSIPHSVRCDFPGQEDLRLCQFQPLDCELGVFDCSIDASRQQRQVADLPDIVSMIRPSLTRFWLLRIDVLDVNLGRASNISLFTIRSEISISRRRYLAADVSRFLSSRTAASNTGSADAPLCSRARALSVAPPSDIRRQPRTPPSPSASCFF